MRRVSCLAPLVAAMALASPAESAPDRTLATVASEAISVSKYRHWNAVQRRAQPRATARAVREATMSFLLSAQWVLGEAAEQGISVSVKQVADRLDRDKRATFKTDRAFRRFLRRTAQTAADLRFRTRVDMLTARLRKTVAPADLKTKWQARTLCHREYAVAEYCGGELPA